MIVLEVAGSDWDVTGSDSEATECDQEATGSIKGPAVSVLQAMESEANGSLVGMWECLRGH